MSQAELAVANENHEENEIHLYVEKTSGAEATIPLRWCACRSVFDGLKSNNVENPCLFLIVAREIGRNTHSGSTFSEVERKVVPLDQAMEWIQFRSPGDYRISATIVYGFALRELRRRLLKRDRDGSFFRSFMDDYGHVDRSLIQYYCNNETVGDGQIDVNVAKEFFAKEPPAWLSNWVNFWYETEPRDQCQYRRRCMLAFTVQPIIVAIWAGFKCSARLVAALLFASVGHRGVNYIVILRPFACRFEDIDSKTDLDSYFFTDRRGKLRNPACWIFTPLILLFILFMSVMICEALRPGCILSAGIVFSWTVAWLVAAPLGKIGMWIVKLGMPRIFGKISAGNAEKRKIKEEKIKKIMAERKRQEGERFKARLSVIYETEYAPVVCTGEPLKADIKELPRKNRTFHLRFWNLKAKVCKPFAK